MSVAGSVFTFRLSTRSHCHLTVFKFSDSFFQDVAAKITSTKIKESISFGYS